MILQIWIAFISFFLCLLLQSIIDCYIGSSAILLGKRPSLRNVYNCIAHLSIYKPYA